MYFLFTGGLANNKGGAHMRKLMLYIMNHGHHMGCRSSTQELTL